MSIYIKYSNIHNKSYYSIWETSEDYAKERCVCDSSMYRDMDWQTTDWESLNQEDRANLIIEFMTNEQVFMMLMKR